MAKLSKLKSKLVRVKADYDDGDVVNMTLRPYAQGWAEAQDWQKKLKESEDDETIALIRSRFCETVTDWDLEGEDGQVIPLTVEGLAAADVPTTLLADFLVKGYADLQSKKPKSGRA